MVSVLEELDFSRHTEPAPAPDLRDYLVAWLGYQRHEFVRKLRDLDPAQLAAWSIPPLELSVLGLVRHMTQMEHHYLSWGLGGGERRLVYGDEDYAGGSVDTVDGDVNRFLAEVEASDRVIAVTGSLEATGLGHGLPLGATLVKMIDEYALHAGQAHMLRFAALGKVLR